MSDAHFEKLLAVLDRQSDDKLNPNLLLGYLGMVNLMSIMSMVHSTMDSGIGQLPASSGIPVELPKSLADENNLKNTINNLMGKAGNNSGNPDISNLLGMVGGNKKLNPQLLLTLMNLMNNMKKNDSPVETEISPAEETEKRDDVVKSKQAEKKGEKKRLY